MSNKRDLLLLFDRPQEPVFVPKGDERAVFDVPNKYLADRYRPISVDLSTRFGEDTQKRISVKNISIPNLDVPMQLKRRDNFSLFIPAHKKMAGRLISIFMGMRNTDDLMSVATYCRDRLNPYLFNYCFSVALLHREDTKDLPIPSFIESFPDKYMDGAVFSRAREELSVVNEGSRTPIEIPKDYTASDLDEEHRVAYFREDMGINLHHWHWHLVYPFDGPDNVIRKDRRGELFYYMHQQAVARYNFERFSNNLARVRRFNNFRETIPEAYFPKMDSLVASRAWPPRFANTRLSDLNRTVDQIRLDVNDLEQWRDRFRAAIEQGFAVGRNNRRVPLDEETGIDTLGNMMEAVADLSPNSQFYGNLHNMGHVFIALSHDPDHRHLETFQVMGDSATAMRDPIFYRWHAYVDELFQLHKGSLPRYTTARLDYPGVMVNSIRVDVEGSQANNLQTFWQRSDIDLDRGMDFAPRGSVFARFTHLQHAPFTYNITVTNSSGGPLRGTCRIFMAPKTDERGLPLLFRDQRLFMIELDKFMVNLNNGQNQITRRSGDSSVTIPFERTFRNLNTRPQEGSAELDQYNFCGCGWPEHMLIPKGTPQGMPCDLFVMISNYNDDRIEQDLVGTCNDSASYCGIRDRRYPDRRSMGYPFDRMPRDGVDTLQSFLTPNMRTQDVTITFTDRTVNRQRT